MPKKTVLLVTLFAVIVPFSTSIGYKRLIARDFDVICEEYKKVLQGPIEGKVQQERKLSENISQRTYMPPVKMALRAVRSASLKSRYSVMLATAKGLGYSSWTCVEMEEYLLKHE